MRRLEIEEKLERQRYVSLEVSNVKRVAPYLAFHLYISFRGVPSRLVFAWPSDASDDVVCAGLIVSRFVIRFCLTSVVSVSCIVYRRYAYLGCLLTLIIYLNVL